MEVAEDAGMGVGERVKGLEDMVLDVEAVEFVESVESVEPCRDLRRKGTDGMRYVGKMEETLWGSLGLRKRAMVAGLKVRWKRLTQVDLSECEHSLPARLVHAVAGVAGGDVVT
jgi:hypothetical protein